MKEVIILGIGPSRVECPFDAEVWAVVRALSVEGLSDRTYSKFFAFDDGSLPALADNIKLAHEKGIPLVSTYAYATEPYPLQEIRKTFSRDFFRNTISYMIAYALYKGYEKIRLYGVDQGPEWHYIVNRTQVMYWIGVADGMAIARNKPEGGCSIAQGSLLNYLMKDNIQERFKDIKRSNDWEQVEWAERRPVFIHKQNVSVRVTNSEGWKPTKRRRPWHKRNILAYLILAALYLIKPFRTVKLCYIRSIAIGQQAGNTGTFLRQRQLHKKKGVTYIGITGKPDNRQLLKMFQRKMWIIESELLSKIHREDIIYKSPFYQDLPFPMDCYDEYKDTRCDLEFTPKEEEQGQTLLRRMGIGKDDWFICFLNRDDAFKGHQDPDRQYSGEFRNSSIKNFMRAAKYITDCGGYAIRLGHYIEKPLKTKNPKIIDYASNYRTDFGDIYLLAKCKFYLGDTAGLWCVANVLNTPVAGVNFIPFHTPVREGDMVLPKRIWHKDLKRLLTFREFIEFQGWQYAPSNIMMLNKLLNGNYEIVENTAKEILDLTREMNERLDGTWKGSEEAQEKFRRILDPGDYTYKTPARIGSNFDLGGQEKTR